MKRWRESVVDGDFEGVDGYHHEQGTEAIEHHWESCLELNGDFVEI